MSSLKRYLYVLRKPSLFLCIGTECMLSGVLYLCGQLLGSSLAGGLLMGIFGKQRAV